MQAALKPYLQIHFCVLLWGFTAILGKLIALPAAALVWWRMLLVSVVVLLLPRAWRAWRALGWRQCALFAGIGIVVALHWVTFYAAIKLANASVAATCMALGAVFTALIEPLFAGRRPRLRELALGIATVPGVALVVGGIPAHMHLGFAVGVLSAALTAVFSTLNKRHAGAVDALAVTGLELGSGTLFLSLLMVLLPDEIAAFELPGVRDGGLLLVLALVCTLLPFALSLVALRQLSAFAVQLALNLEPVYTIALAIPLFGEHRELGAAFYVGIVIVLGCVIAQPLWGACRSTSVR